MIANANVIIPENVKNELYRLAYHYFNSSLFDCEATDEEIIDCNEAYACYKALEYAFSILGISKEWNRTVEADLYTVRS